MALVLLLLVLLLLYDRFAHHTLVCVPSSSILSIHDFRLVYRICISKGVALDFVTALCVLFVWTLWFWVGRRASAQGDTGLSIIFEIVGMLHSIGEMISVVYCGRSLTAMMGFVVCVWTWYVA